MERGVTEWYETMDDFLIGRNWLKLQCGTCQEIYYAKSQQMSEKCGWRKCASAGPHPFMSFPARKRTLSPWGIADHFNNFFRARGYVRVDAKNVADSRAADLIIAGVQILDEYIHGSLPPPKEPILIIQPSVRMKFCGKASATEGISTSFINICTEQVGLAFEEHLAAIDRWFSALSKLGIHMKHVVLRRRDTEKNWGTGSFGAVELFFLYGGLEIGDAAFGLIPLVSGDTAPVSDIGFGLERMAWALNRTDSYFDLISPLSIEMEIQVLDAFRTLALLAFFGVDAAYKKAGLQFRRLCKIVGDSYRKFNAHTLLSQSFDYWERFMTPSRTREEALRSIFLELDRPLAERVQEKLQGPRPSDNETLEEYISKLVYKYSLSVKAVKEALKR